MKRCSLVMALCMTSVWFAITASAPIAADDDADKAENADTKTEPAKKDPLKEWDELTARKGEIMQKLPELKKEFTKADTVRKKEIRDEFSKLVAEWQIKIYPRMRSLADTVYAERPDDIDAADSVMRDAYSDNQYAKTIKIAEKLLAISKQKKEEPNKTVVNMAGAAHFALEHFGRAQEILQDAKEMGLLDQFLGERFLKPAGEYVEFLKEEQEIRKREAAAEGDAQLPQVELITKKGRIVVELFENEAPNTVANFISLVEGKKYDGTKFHRVLSNFMVQGGDPNTLDEDAENDGLGGPGYTIKCECYRKDARPHFRGSLSMAHGTFKDTGGSQFFLTHLPAYWLNADAEKETGHTVFGRVIEGLEFVDAMQKGDELISAKVLRKRNHPYKPEVQREDDAKDKTESESKDDKDTDKKSTEKKANDDK